MRSVFTASVVAVAAVIEKLQTVDASSRKKVSSHNAENELNI
jgi:hypothetical protein